MSSNEIRQKFLDFFKQKGHTIVSSSSLMPTDPSVLFTTAGMQQFKPYYLGEKSPYGNNVASCQKCFRTSDIETVGDESHLTFLEMLGNFSFNGYFKEEAIKLAYEFLFKELKLPIEKAVFTVFEGNQVILEDKESAEIWKKIGIPESKIKKCGKEDNFWGPTGEEGPCGPTTEIHFDGTEVWNLVFNEYYQDKTGKLTPLKQKGVDTGMGLERLAMVIQRKSSVFETDLFLPIISKILSLAGVIHYSNDIPLSVYPRGLLGSNLTQAESIISVRVIIDHIKAATFLIADGVVPSNKERGYILRRLIRRIITRGKRIGISKIGSENFLSALSEVVLKQYAPFYPELKKNQKKILDELDKEETKFRETLVAGLKKMEEYVVKKESADKFLHADRADFGSRSEDYITLIPGKDAFDLYQTYGFPPELLNEELSRYGMGYHEGEFQEEFKKHQEISRASADKKFKGGLADSSEQTIKYHTATHLLLAALREILSSEIYQKGSNITAERLRFDFNYPEKLNEEQIKKVEELVNKKIQENITVEMIEMPKKEALKTVKISFDPAEYGDIVKVYKIGDFSAELCGGPHIKTTGELGQFKIIKEESCGAGIRRIRAILS